MFIAEVKNMDDLHAEIYGLEKLCSFLCPLRFACYVLKYHPSLPRWQLPIRKLIQGTTALATNNDLTHCPTNIDVLFKIAIDNLSDA